MTGLPELARSARTVVAGRIIRDTSSLLFAAQVLTAGTAFVANILSARVMGPGGRGELALLLQITYFASIAVLLGCDRSVVAVYSGHPIRMVATAFFRLLVRPSLIVLVLAAGVLALPVQGLESWRVRLACAALFVVVISFSTALRSVAIAGGGAVAFVWYEVIWSVLTLIALGLTAALGLASSTAWILAYLVSGLLALTIALTAGARISRPAVPQDEPSAGEQEEERDRRRRARREGLQLFPGTLANSATLRLDRLILAGLASTAALGLYATVGTMTELISWPLLVFADSRLGAWRQAHDRGTLSFSRVVGVAVAYAVVAAGLATLVLRTLLVPLLGERFAPALPLIAPLAVAAAVFGLLQLLTTALTAIHFGPVASGVGVAALVVSVLAYVLLIERFGALGAAYGSLIGYTSGLVMAAALFVVLRRNRSAAPVETHAA